MNNYQFTVKPEERIVISREGETILDTAIRNKVNIKVGCKGGGCGVCKIKVLEGKVEQGICSRTALSLEEIEEGYILACKAKSKSDMVISNEIMKSTLISASRDR